MGYEFLLLDIQDGIATITLNRPEVFNAFNNEMSFELQDAIKQVSRDEQVRVVILTGAGKAFCSGQDLKSARGADFKGFADSVRSRYNPIIKGLRNMPKPVIARMQGIAAGAGCSLAMACDLIVAAEEAAMLEAFINIGLVLDSGASYFLPRLIGSQRAFEMAVLGEKIPAQKAHEWGMIYQVVPMSELDQATQHLAQRLAQAPTKAVGLMKKMLNQSFHSSLDDMLDIEAYYQEIAGRSGDYKEGVAAFTEKRKPNFRGQ